MGKKLKKLDQIKKDEGVADNVEELRRENTIKTEEEIKTESGESMPHRNKQARLIVRNLSFKATEDKVRKFFSSFGDLTDVQILRRPDGRLVGCCFVEFALKTSAAKAIAHVSGRPFLDRTVVVDWAVPKDKFIQKTTKTTSDESEESGFHEEDEKKAKIVSVPDIKKEEGEGSDESEAESDSDSDLDKNTDNESDVCEDEEEESGDDSLRRKPLRESHDISEGCTVFVKNIPFSVDNQEFRKCMQQFGPVYYALICIDHLTEHSKGTGFVKFRTKNVAEACITAGKEGSVMLRNSVLEIHPALSREDLHQGPTKKTKAKKDGRNLYLIKEGVILAGSPAASDVSPADMAKRLQLEQWKTQMLKNLNKFVSTNRLVIQNLPPSYDDPKLRSLFLKYGGHKPVITEARVMRDLRNVDANGKGKSKEFGFVTFTSHENALHALRALNNNPDIFTPSKRPIVAFSIEDRKALNIRKKRLEKSRTFTYQNNTDVSQRDWEKKQQAKKLNNKLQPSPIDKKVTRENKSMEVEVQAPEAPVSSEKKLLSKKEKRKLKKQKSLSKPKDEIGSKIPSQLISKKEKFVGEKATKGQPGIMSRQKLREQAELQDKMKKTKSKTKRQKQQLAAIKIKQPRQKIGKPKELRQEDNFAKLVNKYKNQLASSGGERKKWYDD